MTITIDGQRMNQRFYVVNIGKQDMILGHAWLKEFNPTIDWEQGQSTLNTTLSTPLEESRQ